MDWQSRLIPGFGPEGEPLLSVLAKRTYALVRGGICVPWKEEPIPFFEKDEYYDEGDVFKSATRHESDLVAYKPLVDFILHACAWSPRGKKAYFLDVGAKVGNYAKIARVFGNRRAFMSVSGPQFSEPEPFDKMRLDFSKAYGGVDCRSNPDEPVPYFRNPVGKGFLVSNNPRCIQDLPLPNVEDPNQLLAPERLCAQKVANWVHMPKPMAFGYTSRNFHPRITLAGLPAEQHRDSEAARKAQEAAAPQVGAPGSEGSFPAPLMRPEFFNGAADGLRLPHVKGGEEVRLRNMDPDHAVFEFKLPEDKPALWLDLGRGRVYLPAVLQTVEVFKETGQVTLLWRGSARYAGPDSLSQVEKFEGGAEDG